MAAAGIRALKNLLSQYLKRVRAGERLVVTERREPVAIISPLAVVRLPAKCPLGVVNCASWRSVVSCWMDKDRVSYLLSVRPRGLEDEF